MLLAWLYKFEDEVYDVDKDDNHPELLLYNLHISVVLCRCIIHLLHFLKT